MWLMVTASLVAESQRSFLFEKEPIFQPKVKEDIFIFFFGNHVNYQLKF